MGRFRRRPERMTEEPAGNCVRLPLSLGDVSNLCPVAAMPEDQHQENSPKSKAGLPDSSMEEIIASISRIIDEDSRTPHPSPRAAAAAAKFSS